jgi:hypothetical protein
MNLKTLFSPREYTDFGINQRSRLLQVALILTGFATLIFGLLNLSQQATGLATYLLVFSLVCLIAAYLNYRGKYQIGCSLFLTLCLLAIDFNLFDGAALHDPGVAAFPIFILFSGFMLDRKGILAALIASILSVFVLLYGHQAGWFVLNAEPTLNRALVLTTLFFLSAGITWEILFSFQKAEENAEEAYQHTIQGLVRALELRDIETLGHSERVTNIAAQLGIRLGLSRKEMENLQLGALLHDIGKLGIKDSILLKPDKLTAEEYETVKKHTNYAFNVLKNIPRFRDAVTVPHYHHEQWDGKGYPEGLKGDEIPLLARIFSVVDQWDALRSSRPYRDAWSETDAKKYIQDGAGTRYDPKIVDAFLEMLQSSEFVRYISGRQQDSALPT